MPDLLLLFEPKKRDVLETELPSWTPYLKDYEDQALVNDNIIKGANPKKMNQGYIESKA